MNNDGTTALHRAASNGEKDEVEALLAQGADVNIKDNSGLTPLMKASWNGRKEVVKQLLAKGAHVGALTTALRLAREKVSWGSNDGARTEALQDVIELLINAGARRSPPSDSALYMAANNGESDRVALLLSEGANVDARSSDGCSYTALMVACGNGHKEVVELLLSNGAWVNAKDRYKATALHWARSRDDIIQMLKRYGACG